MLKRLTLILAFTIFAALQSPANPSKAAGVILGCSLFPADNLWNARIDTLPVDSHSAQYIQAIGANTGLHPDFGAGEWDGGPIGIPYNGVSGDQAKVPVDFTWPDESDPGPYPIPANSLREWGSDHHILIVDQGNCILYELYAASQDGSVWHAGSGAIFDLHSNTLRPDGWTSADAAGLPILAGLARYEEVALGAITHALRFTVHTTNGNYTWPARHRACSGGCDDAMPPMGQYFRLKADFNINDYSPQVQVILQALKTYGMIVADNGSDWYLSGAPNAGWDDDALVSQLRMVHGSDFEAVDVSSLMIDPNSGQVPYNPPGNIKFWLPLVVR